MPTPPGMSPKDSNQVLRAVMDDDTNRLRVDAIISPDGHDLEIHHEDDSIAIGTPTELFTATDVGSHVALDVNVVNSVTVDQGTTPWIISGTFTSSDDHDYGLVGVDTLRTAAQIGNATGAADFDNGPTGPQTLRTVSNQGTDPWIVSGSFSSSDDHNYGLVGANTLRTAAQIGNDTGAADFNSGPTGPQTLRVDANQGTSPWTVDGTVAATQSGIWTTGRTWVLDSTTDSVTVDNFPTSFIVNQGTTPWDDNISQFGGNAVVIGTGPSGVGIPRVTVSNDSNILATQSGTWDIGTLTSITNPVAVTQSTSPWVVSGTVTANQGTSPWVVSGSVSSADDHNYGLVGAATLRTAAQIGNATGAADFNSGVTGAQTLRTVANQGGTWTTGRTWVLDNSTDSVGAVQLGTWDINTVSTITNPVTVNQGTSPWIVSGTVTSGDDHNYGLVGATTLRTAAQIGNATGAADFNSGVTGAQTLRTVSNQGGTWSTGRTWALSSGTDSVNIGNFPATQSVTQGTSPWVVSGTVAATQSGTWTVQQGTPPWTIQGDSASGAAKAGNPVQTGGVFNTTQPTVTTGQTVEAQSTARGAQIVATGVDPFTVTQGTSPWVVSGTAVVTASTVSTASNTIVLVSNSVSTQLLAANSNRRMVYITNNNNKSLWVKLGATAVVGQGIEVGGGGSFGIDSTGLWTGIVNGIVSGGSSLNIDVFEGTP